MLEINLDEIIKNISFGDYAESPIGLFAKIPDFAKQIVNNAQNSLGEIEKILYKTPIEFINLLLKSSPDINLQAVLSSDQKKQLLAGSLKLLTKKDGTLLATLVNPDNGKMIANVPLEEFKSVPNLNQAISNFTSQMQMAQIAEQIEEISKAIESVRSGQEDDRLAIAYSCQQKLIQLREIRNPELKSRMLMQVISDAEDSRNLLMLSQKANLKYLQEQPKGTIEKFLKGDKSTKIEKRISEVRNGLNAVNMVSLAEAIAYNELGEYEAARSSLLYFADFLRENYLMIPGLVDRLDMIDPSPVNYWSKTLPEIENNILLLPTYNEGELLEEENTDER